MDNPRPEKVAVVDEVRERFSSSSGALLTEYRGLDVAEIGRLRQAVADAGGSYKVYKNTLVRFAVRDLGLAELEALLEGPTAIAFVDGDVVNVAKALRDFARSNPTLVVKGGVLGDRVLSVADAGALADVPPRDVLLARFAGGLAAPLQQMAGLLGAVQRNFAYGVRALIDKGGAAPAAEAQPAAEPAEAAEPAAAAAPDTTETTETTETAETAEVAEPEGEQ